ncbi:MAG: nucleotide sugar dehydrogenase, partial [Pseudoalteromonas sp.]|uniref:nucleotide sugar dehydrogenase n=1 Tax=Pseudoalteromonas sp. TaxID=53249 RepID=UPI0025EE8303
IISMPNCKTANAVKLTTNVFRDINIAFINEVSMLFHKLKINTNDVLKTAATKWNFLNFKPGLVGGHCISVDPYYLTHKAQEVGYRPEVILAGRRINDGMGEYVATQLVKKLASKKIHIDEAKVLILGFTFKGDCPDVRNTKIIDIVKELQDFNMSVDVYDGWANPAEVKHEYGVELITTLEKGKYDGVVLAVDHSELKEMGEANLRALGKENHVLYDVKHVLKPHEADIRL